MGMFFYVKKEDGEKCPYCGEELKENYQSKSDVGSKHDVYGGCCERHPGPLPLLEKDEVENFYTICESCEKWIEYEVIPKDYKLVENKS